MESSIGAGPPHHQRRGEQSLCGVFFARLEDIRPCSPALPFLRPFYPAVAAHTNQHSKKGIKPGEWRSLYFPYHSLAPAQGIERILEAKGLHEEDYTKRGVEIMRRIILEKR